MTKIFAVSVKVVDVSGRGKLSGISNAINERPTAFASVSILV
jgi:hypothetical protein